MDKRKAIQIMTKAARLYKDNLEDRKILFLYGTPAEVKKHFKGVYRGQVFCVGEG